MSKRGLHIDLIEHFQHDTIGCRLSVGRYGQVGPHDERQPIGGIAPHERVVAGHLAAVEIQRVRSEAKLGDAVPVLLAVGHARVLGLQAVEPPVLIVRVEHPAANQCLHPGDEVIGGGDDAAGRRGI